MPPPTVDWLHLRSTSHTTSEAFLNSYTKDCGVSIQNRDSSDEGPGGVSFPVCLSTCEGWPLPVLGSGQNRESESGKPAPLNCATVRHPLIETLVNRIVHL